MGRKITTLRKEAKILQYYSQNGWTATLAHFKISDSLLFRIKKDHAAADKESQSRIAERQKRANGAETLLLLHSAKSATDPEVMKAYVVLAIEHLEGRS